MPVWINGSVQADDEAKVSAFDHGLTVGDGVFETIKVESGRPIAFTRHLRRLGRSAAGLGLPTVDESYIRRGVDALVSATIENLHRPPADLARLRITLTGGRAPLGSDRGNAAPTVVIALAPMQPWPASVAAVTVPWVRNERSPVAGLKTTSYAENVVALAFAHDYGASEAIFANSLGNLCEGTGTNVFAVVDDRVVTPPLSAGCLGGITRQLLIEWADVVEQDLPLASLTTASEVFITSSTRDVQGVHDLDGRTLPGVEGQFTRKLAEVYADRIAANPDP